MSYFEKYIKYKNKYLELKKTVGGQSIKVGDQIIRVGDNVKFNINNLDDKLTTGVVVRMGYLAGLPFIEANYGNRSNPKLYKSHAEYFTLVQ